VKHYIVNEIFYSLQGEGRRAGTASVFVRFAHCNLECRVETHGFDCDTEFASGRRLTLKEIHQKILDELSPYGLDIAVQRPWIVYTGGEPALQLDDECVTFFSECDFRQAIETNGTKEIPDGLDWVCVSPKAAEHTLRIRGHIDELKYVRHDGQGYPRPSLKADHYLLSPAFNPTGNVNLVDLLHCIHLCKKDPTWKLSVQQHKYWGVR